MIEQLVILIVTSVFSVCGFFGVNWIKRIEDRLDQQEKFCAAHRRILEAIPQKYQTAQLTDIKINGTKTSINQLNTRLNLLEKRLAHLENYSNPRNPGI